MVELLMRTILSAFISATFLWRILPVKEARQQSDKRIRHTKIKEVLSFFKNIKYNILTMNDSHYLL